MHRIFFLFNSSIVHKVLRSILHVLLPYCFGTYVLGHNRHIFLRGQSHFSWLFFPVENFHFGRPKTNFRHFQTWKEKKKKKKKKGPHQLFVYYFSYFHTSNFPPSLLQFSFFSSQFSPFSPLSPFFPVRQQKFPVRSLWGALCPPPVTPLPRCSLVQVLSQELQSPASECEFHHFSKLTLLQCLLHNLFSFKFSANLTSKNVRGNHNVSSLVCSLASEYTNQKFSKTSTFSCPYLIFHSVILLTPPFQYIFFQTFVYCLLQKYLWEHVPTLFTFFCYHVVQNIRVLWVPMCLHIYERPESLAQKS